MTKERQVKAIHFHKEMEPEPKIEVFTHTVNGEPVKGLSIALYSPKPERDWCVQLTAEEALNMAQKITETYSDSLTEKLDHIPIIQGYSVTVTDPDGEVLIKHDSLPTIYDIQGVVEEYINEEVD